jgi:glycosyltransferase involved in cell wall biosynthesis
MSPSGVGTQTRYIVEGLLRTGKFQVTSLGGAMKHHNYDPVKTEEFGNDWVILPVDGYGSQELIRAMMRQHKPDIVWFMTDPRFWGWLWKIENEIRASAPLVYYHVWDNYPAPHFNKRYYDSNDVIVTISQLTNNIVKEVAPDMDVRHIQHAVNSEIFKPSNKEENKKFKKGVLKEKDSDKFIFFWNNRNARRKQSGSLIYWFKAFLDKVGHDKATLIMHTDPLDPHGQDLNIIIKQLNLDNGQVLISQDKYDQEVLAKIYSMADCTINISDAEGFGLSTLESLSCGTPIIVNMTGGLQEQVTDGDEWFGIGLEPTSKAVIGSQDVPYIYEDRLSEEVVVEAFTKMYNMSKEEREELGKKGRNYVMKNYNFEDFTNSWVELLSEIHFSHGSWEGRKNYKSWSVKEIS